MFESLKPFTNEFKKAWAEEDTRASGMPESPQAPEAPKAPDAPEAPRTSQVPQDQHATEILNSPQPLTNMPNSQDIILPPPTANPVAVHCPRCNSLIQPSVKFCPECGAINYPNARENEGASPFSQSPSLKIEQPVETTQYTPSQTKADPSSQPSTERKVEFAGRVLKCPQCGDPIEPFEATCDSCGFVFRDTVASDSLREFAYALVQLDETNATINNPILFKNRLVTLIRNFAIPNNKQDIIEFFMLAQTNLNPSNLAWSQSDSATKKEVAEAWLVKLNQAYNKARITFSNDKEFAYIESEYQRTIESIEEAMANEHRSIAIASLKNSIGIIVAVLLLIVSCCILIASSRYDSPAYLLALGAFIVLCLGSAIAGKQTKQASNLLIPAIGCLLFILIGLIPIDSSWQSFALFGGIAGLGILLFTFFSHFHKTKSDQTD